MFNAPGNVPGQKFIMKYSDLIFINPGITKDSFRLNFNVVI